LTAYLKGESCSEAGRKEDKIQDPKWAHAIGVIEVDDVPESYQATIG
jgi:hypothetical protein